MKNYQINNKYQDNQMIVYNYNNKLLMIKKDYIMIDDLYIYIHKHNKNTTSLPFSTLIFSLKLVNTLSTTGYLDKTVLIFSLIPSILSLKIS